MKRKFTSSPNQFKKIEGNLKQMLGKIWDKFGKNSETPWNKFWRNLGEAWKNLFKF